MKHRQRHHLRKPPPGLSWFRIVEAIETLRAGRDLLWASLVDVDAVAHEAPDAATGVIIDSHTTAVSQHLMSRGYDRLLLAISVRLHSRYSDAAVRSGRSWDAYANLSDRRRHHTAQWPR
jgi:hypothetical protein